MAHLVSGEGNPRARLMLIGEAPGAEEERLGRPFVGQAGRLLDSLLAAAGLSRDALWITNVVKERPTRNGRNRAPTQAEIRQWLPVLQDEIARIRPSVIVCLGAVAAKAVIGRDFSLSRGRGKAVIPLFGALALATWHPAFLLRQVGPAREARVREFIGDLLHAKALARNVA